MVLRIHNLESWIELAAGKAIPLFAGKRRVIRIDFNAETETAVHMTDPAGQVCFIGLVKGLQTVEFTAGDPRFAEAYADPSDAKLLITATSEGGVWYRMVDGDVESYSSVAESFVKVATRRERNPQLELMMWKQEQNMRRREEKLAGDVAALMARLDAQAAAVEPPAPDEEVSANDNDPTPASEDAAGEVATPPAGGSDGGGAASKAGSKAAPKGAK